MLRGKGIIHSVHFKIFDMLTDPTGSTFILISGFSHDLALEGKPNIATCWNDSGDKIEIRTLELAKMVWSGIWKLN